MTKTKNNSKIIDIEKALVDMIGKYKLEKKLSVEKIKSLIFKDNHLSVSEAFNKFQAKVFKYFPVIDDIDELNEIFIVLSDAWNYFPHEALGGKSPCEVASISLIKEKGEQDVFDKTMPRVNVGGQEMSWEEYQEMIEKMEKLQIPFKNWIDYILKEYKNFLSKASMSAKVIDKHYKIADIFFERVLYIGCLNIEDIPASFIHEDFPKWWQTHVLFDNSNKKVVISSLYKLFNFIQLVTLMDIKQFGF
ncbi:MAG TPA: hypothetical protein PLE28_02785 [bacterium]|nr:hypothetical protein [bacterium]